MAIEFIVRFNQVLAKEQLALPLISEYLGFNLGSGRFNQRTIKRNQGFQVVKVQIAELAVGELFIAITMKGFIALKISMKQPNLITTKG